MSTVPTPSPRGSRSVRRGSGIRLPRMPHRFVPARPGRDARSPWRVGAPPSARAA